MAESDKNSDEKSTFETDNNEELTYSDFKDLTAYDSTCELVAYVEGIDGPKIVGTNRLMIFKVFLANDNGEKLQLISWNDEVRMIEPKISVNNILHLDGVYVKPSQRGKYNSVSEDYELVVQSNSKINVLGRRESKEEEKKAEVEEIVLPLSTF
ncbi:uncharacterized protein LOC141535293 [Cotesia typhae]|uniref:uncharacterized protein LOC141535293 n=1 Tax=Cotesia typhae TaxID=2053667 RepID=UPI003D69EC14